MRAPSKNTCVFSIIAFSLLIPLSVWGQVLIHIPTDQPTIQAGIDAAQNEADEALAADKCRYRRVDLGRQSTDRRRVVAR